MTFEQFKQTLAENGFDVEAGVLDEHADLYPRAYFTYQKGHAAVAYDSKDKSPWFFSCRGAHGHGDTLRKAMLDEDANYECAMASYENG